MKTRFVIATAISFSGLILSSAWAVLPPASGTLPNYDVRTEARAAAKSAAAIPNAAQDAAAAALNVSVPGARVTHDSILGSPSFVSATYGFLSGPDGKGRGISEASLAAIPAGDSNRVVKAFLNEHAALFGYDSQILAGSGIQRDYVTEHSGLRTTIWQQKVDDISVFEGLLISHVTRQGELVSISTHFVASPVQAAAAGTPNRSALISNPAISAVNAIASAAANIGLSIDKSLLTVSQAPQGMEKKEIFQSSELFGPTQAHLVWFPMDGNSLRLCWRVILTTKTSGDRYSVLVDAQTGEALLRRLMTVHAVTPASYNVFTSDSPSPFSPGLSAPGTDQPPYVNRTLVTLTAESTNASPIGWVSEGDSPQTSGNNAIAFLDRNFNGSPDGPLPTALTNRTFDFPMNLTNDAPLTYQKASTVQLFYRANWYHDRLYDLGFTEAAGNYQVNNFGRGGLGGDPVVCLVQAGADVGFTDNSRFLPADDGFSGYCCMFVFTGPSPDRDGSLDQEVVIHELTHGTSCRLVGGGVGISQFQTAGMGEGWSDFYALCLLSEPSDDIDGAYPSGGYASYQLEGFDENYYFGIRRYPYTTDMSKNPLTFKDIDPLKADNHFGVPISPLVGGGDPSEVHNQGEVWCVTLREVWANLVNKLGWAEGNLTALQLVTDGMKLCPPNPTFLEGRDAIIQADQVDNSGENYAEIWAGFAKRGMGYSAYCPPSDTTVGVNEAFDLPPSLVPDGIMEIRFNPPSGDVLFTRETNSIFIGVADGKAVTNATITSSVVGGSNLVFKNDGIAPDKKALDSVYSSSLVLPATPGLLTLNSVISAPGKTNATNVVTYTIVPPPSNDNFSNATKVPAAGASYLTGNKRATTENGEPAHAGIFSSAASLWWNYTPAADTSLLVDAGGSSFQTIVAVYTNNSLAALQPVVSAIGTFTRLGASVNFNAHAGVTYHIALAGYGSGAIGVVSLNIAPGAQADTNPPVVTIDSPLDGSIVSANNVLVSGSAVDPSPNPSGIKSILISSFASADGMPVSSREISAMSLIGPANTNWSSLVALTPGQNTIQVSAVDYAGNRSAAVSIHALYRVLSPANDFFANAIALTNTSGVSSVNTIDATKEAGEPNHAGNGGGKSAWWTFVPPADGVLSLSTSNSTFDTVLAVYTGSTVASLTPLSGNDDAYDNAPGGFSKINQAVRSGQTYRIAVDGYDGLSGVVFLSYSFAPAKIFHVTSTSTAGGTATPSSMDVQSNGVAVLSAAPNANYQFDLWDGGAVSLANPLSIVVKSDMNIAAHFRPVTFTDGFESGNFLALPWAQGGNKPWIVQTNIADVGNYSARSGVINNNQSSALMLTGNFRSGAGSFDVRVSSEQNYDFLRFFVDGVQVQQWSGEAAWATFAFPIAAGTHTLEWRYVKDSVGSSGLDGAFIDNLNLPLIVGTNAFTSAHLQLARQMDGSFFVNLSGQTNQQYILQTSTNLVNWLNLSTNVATSGYLRIADPASASNRMQFYRAVVIP